MPRRRHRRDDSNARRLACSTKYMCWQTTHRASKQNVCRVGRNRLLLRRQSGTAAFAAGATTPAGTPATAPRPPAVAPRTGYCPDHTDRTIHDDELHAPKTQSKRGLPRTRPGATGHAKEATKGKDEEKTLAPARTPDDGGSKTAKQVLRRGEPRPLPPRGQARRTRPRKRSREQPGGLRPASAHAPPPGHEVAAAAPFPPTPPAHTPLPIFFFS